LGKETIGRQEKKLERTRIAFREEERKGKLNEDY